MHIMRGEKQLDLQSKETSLELQLQKIIGGFICLLSGKVSLSDTKHWCHGKIS